MTNGNMVQHEAAFRPRARLVSILGEHLISDQAVGLVELVKNAYDADAIEVEGELLDLGRPENTTVVISDNGNGMTEDDVRTKWLSPAVDHKERNKRENRRTRLGGCRSVATLGGSTSRKGQESQKISACWRTVSVAFSCLSGG